MPPTPLYKILPVISPKNQPKWAQGKTIVTTGGGGAIGCIIALSSSKVDNSTAIPLGRTESTCDAANSDIESKVPNLSVGTLRLQHKLPASPQPPPPSTP